jgi:hypothetical protein
MTEISTALISSRSPVDGPFGQGASTSRYPEATVRKRGVLISAESGGQISGVKDDDRLAARRIRPTTWTTGRGRHSAKRNAATVGDEGF